MHVQAEGIFRINAENSQEEFVRNQLNAGVVPEGIDLHCLAGLIKVQLCSRKAFLKTFHNVVITYNSIRSECLFAYVGCNSYLNSPLLIIFVKIKLLPAWVMHSSRFAVIFQKKIFKGKIIRSSIFCFQFLVKVYEWLPMEFGGFFIHNCCSKISDPLPHHSYFWTKISSLPLNYWGKQLALGRVVLSKNNSCGNCCCKIAHAILSFRTKMLYFFLNCKDKT